MLLAPTTRLPEGPTYELKLDGYRALAIKSGGRVELRSRKNKDFSPRYPAIVQALSSMPDDTVLDGEIVALDAASRPSFNLLQNFGDAKAPIVYYVFDVLFLGGRDVMAEPLSTRRVLLRDCVLPLLNESVRESAILEANLADLIARCARGAWRVLWPSAWIAAMNLASAPARGRKCGSTATRNL